MITYLNTPQSSEVSTESGCLRVFPANGKTTDIYPKQGRCILFLSDVLAHQVLPLKNPTEDRIERFALTIWFNHVKEDRKGDEGKVFVGIPCYRDEEIVPTVMSLVSRADQPQRLVIGILLQIDFICQSD